MKENHLLNQIKSAAENAETKNFPGMEKVWHRVEEKLDHKENKKAVWRWKKIAVAASLLLVTTLGYQFFKSNPTVSTPNKEITVTDSVEKPTTVTNEITTSEPKPETKPNPLLKKEAEQILKQQITPETQVALEESIQYEEDNAIVNTVPSAQRGYFSAPAAPKSDNDFQTSFTFKTKKAELKNVELFFDKNSKVSGAQKEEPLLIIDDKVSKQDLKKVEFTEADSLIVLKEPLYIINGVEYTEQEVFGPNPTSPYTPLNKQEIETLSILQDEKAVEIYGTKGNKGVVIITTKNGKPVNASKKAK